MSEITRQTVADKLAAYLRHDLSRAELVAWAESAMMDGEFEREHFTDIRDVVARLGVADVRTFGLAWSRKRGQATLFGVNGFRIGSA